MNNFDSIVAGSLSIAEESALKYKNAELSPMHLLYGLIKNPNSYSHKKLKSYKKEIENKVKLLPVIMGKVGIDQIRASAKLSEWMTRASSHAIQANRSEIGESDLLRFLPDILPEIKIDFKDFNFLESEEEEIPDFLINLNELAENGKLDPVIGREKEIRAVMEILGRRSKNNPVLIGEAGVGKTAIVEGVAEAIIKGDIPDMLKDKIILSLDMGSLMAGTKFRGEFEERIQKLIKYIKDRPSEVILFIDEIHQLVGAGKTDGAMDAANLLKPALARGELNCIGATTPNEYQKYILGDAALDRRFRPVVVSDPSKEDAIHILMGIREKMEIHHGIKISDEAIYNAVVLSDQYITEKHLPDKAIDLIDEASSAMKISAESMPAKLVELEALIRSKKIYTQVHKDKKIESEITKWEIQFNKEKEVWEQEVFSIKRVQELKNRLDKLKLDLEQSERKQDYENASQLKYSIIPEVEKEIDSCSHDWILQIKDIALVIARSTGIPIEKILKSKQDNILKLKDSLELRVFGQGDSIEEIADILITSHAGLSDESRPLGSFLLKGPSGVGKTETAKALASFLFDNEDNLVRLDMSEFSERHSIAKLIGSPAGYVGYEEGGVLTEAIRKRPYAIILFDEIEKAHPDFSDILLQILDDGRLTDNKGRTISFKNTIIFLTTNSRSIENDFKPEVLGRLDAILTYNQLDKSIMSKLVERQLKLLNLKLESKDIHVELSSNVFDEMVELGFDERYGARPLHSLFNKRVIRPLSKRLLKGELQKSGGTVCI